MISFYMSLDWTTRALILSVILSVLIFIKQENSKFGSALVMSGLIYFWIWACHFADNTMLHYLADAVTIFVILVYNNISGTLFWIGLCLCIGMLFPGLATIGTIAACGLLGIQLLSWMGILRRA